MKKKPFYRKIVVWGGYGYGNTGDEAQLNEVLKTLKKEFPGFEIRVLTPHLEYTQSVHNCVVAEAPREAFFIQNQVSKTLYYLKNRKERFKFLCLSLWIYLNCLWNSKLKLPLLLSPKKIACIYELSSANLIYFTGGGYMTGATLSRLWDGSLSILIGSLYKVPSVLSGQTIGLWRNGIDRFIARKAFKKARFITLRDPIESPKALKEINIDEEKYSVMFDDALFCDKLPDKETAELIRETGLSPEENYIVFNIHLWGVNNEEEEDLHMTRLKNVFDLMRKEYPKEKVVFIPMHESDETAIHKFIDRFAPENCLVFQYDYDFKKIRSIISGACLCVTQKHHPIIFAVGEKVPVISISFRDYYVHKNWGALEIFGLGKYNTSLESEQFDQEFSTLLGDTRENRNEIVEHITRTLDDLTQRKAIFMDKVKQLVYSAWDD